MRSLLSHVGHVPSPVVRSECAWGLANPESLIQSTIIVLILIFILIRICSIPGNSSLSPSQPSSQSDASNLSKNPNAATYSRTSHAHHMSNKAATVGINEREGGGGLLPVNLRVEIIKPNHTSNRKKGSKPQKKKKKKTKKPPYIGCRTRVAWYVHIQVPSHSPGKSA